MKYPYKHVHGGHRQRLKDKVRQNGLTSLSLHEVLELILTYTIPQKDTNQLAHELIDTYGSFSKVLEADYYDLMKNKGVGEETALFLSMLPRLFDIFKEDKEENDINFLRSPYECVKYFRSKYEIKNKEFLYVVCLNNSCKIMKTIIIEGNSDNSVSIDIKKFANMINNENTASIVLFHTHPNGEVKPSREDILTTQNILNICCIMNVVLCDHIILNEKDYFSFGRDNLLFDMYNKFSKNFSLSISNKQDMCQHIGFKYDE